MGVQTAMVSLTIFNGGYVLYKAFFPSCYSPGRINLYMEIDTGNLSVIAWPLLLYSKTPDKKTEQQIEKN